MRLTFEPTMNRQVLNNDPRFMEKTISIELPCDSMNLVEFMESMVKPLLLSMGYSRVAIDKFITINEDA